MPRRGLIDPDTPADNRTRIGTDGHIYELVFSDEFNEDGRSFWSGDDPYWEAGDLHYWSTRNLEVSVDHIKSSLLIVFASGTRLDKSRPATAV